jgi:hypothetical protein
VISNRHFSTLRGKEPCRYTETHMNSLAKTLKGYVWWTYPRGSLHYDVMVTLILMFVFLAPLFINFNDKPAERSAHLSGVEVTPLGSNSYLYHIDAAAVQGKTEDQIRQSLMGVIEPIAGEVKLLRYEEVRDKKGNVTAYNVWVRRGLGG